MTEIVCTTGSLELLNEYRWCQGGKLSLVLASDFRYCHEQWPKILTSSNMDFIMALGVPPTLSVIAMSLNKSLITSNFYYPPNIHSNTLDSFRYRSKKLVKIGIIYFTSLCEIRSVRESRLSQVQLIRLCLRVSDKRLWKVIYWRSPAGCLVPAVRILNWMGFAKW